MSRRWKGPGHWQQQRKEKKKNLCRQSFMTSRTRPHGGALQQRQAAHGAAGGALAQQPRKALAARHVTAWKHAPVRVGAHLGRGLAEGGCSVEG